jgi:FMN-dependent NADH-azoreductase
MKLLHIDASILGENSVSRQISAAIVENLRRTQPGLEIIYRDLAAAPPAHLTAAAFAAGAEDPVLHEFLDADIVVIGAPMYNFGVPSQLKAWIDRILVAGQTFRYGANGVEGLAGGKRVIAAISRGGLYGPESPAAAMEHVETYLRTVFGFIGIANPEIIVAEGVMLGPDQRQQTLQAALEAAGRLEARAAA